MGRRSRDVVETADNKLDGRASLAMPAGRLGCSDMAALVL
jgi:hypothetical protein